MNFKSWLESFVYHGSVQPISVWDRSRHVSGYYPGFYAWPERESAQKHGQYVYELNVDDGTFYTLSNADDLKVQARKAGFPVTSGSGHQDVEYLKSLGYKGIRRGKEYIIFSPEEWSSTPKLS